MSQEWFQVVAVIVCIMKIELVSKSAYANHYNTLQRREGCFLCFLRSVSKTTSQQLRTFHIIWSTPRSTSSFYQGHWTHPGDDIGSENNLFLEPEDEAIKVKQPSTNPRIHLDTNVAEILKAQVGTKSFTWWTL